MGKLGQPVSVIINTAGSASKPNPVPIRHRLPDTRATIIHLQGGCCHSPHATYPEAMNGPFLKISFPIWSCTGRGLPSFPGHPENWCALTAPFHPYQNILKILYTGGLLSVALSFTSPRLHVMERPCPVVFGLSSKLTRL